MRIPKEFELFAAQFYDVPPVDLQDQEVWVHFKVKCLQKEDRYVVRKFLNQLLQDGVDSVELEKIWRDGGAGFFLGNVNEMPKFIKALIDRLSEQL